MVDLILFPSSFFSITKVDEDLQNEYDAVLAAGLSNRVRLSAKACEQVLNKEK